MIYVYILKSQGRSGRRYVGITRDLRSRLKVHNAGGSSHTAKFQPWGVESYVAFSNEQKAREFERYLKSGSGREFARRHF